MNKDQIKSIRLKLKMTRQEFATAVGVSHASVLAWENGTRHPSKYFSQRINMLSKDGSNIQHVVLKAGSTLVIRGE